MRGVPEKVNDGGSSKLTPLLERKKWSARASGLKVITHSSHRTNRWGGTCNNKRMPLAKGIGLGSLKKKRNSLRGSQTGL